MTKVTTSYSNFAKAKIDHDMMGRYDLPIYGTGADIFQNFVSNFKGNAIYTSGFLTQETFQDCEFVEFKFNSTQNYLCVFYNLKVRFLAFDTNGVFGWVIDGSSNILEVTTPYTLAETHEIQYAQNYDVMYIAHRSHPPMKLTRTAANAFTLATYTRTADPFTSTNNYPGAVQFYGGSLFFASTNTKGTTLWWSNKGLFDDFTIQSPLTDASGFSINITDIAQRIEWLYPGDNSLIAGSTDGIVPINGGGVNTAITPATVQARISSADPTNGVYPIKKDGLIFYIGVNNRNMYSFNYDLLSESFLSDDANIISYDITKGGLSKIRYKKDRNDLIFTLRNTGDLCSLNFKKKENIIGWHERLTDGTFEDLAVLNDNLGNPRFVTLMKRAGVYYIEMQAEYVEFVDRDNFVTPGPEFEQEKYKDIDNEAYNRYIAEQLRGCVYLDGAVTFSDLRSSTITYDPVGGTITAGASSFSSGDVGKHIVYKTLTGYESGRFEITAYTSATVVSVDVLQEPLMFNGLDQTDLLVWSSWYKSFMTLSGLGAYTGQTVGVCTDGGYLSDYTIVGTSLTFPGQTTSVVLGYKYTGIIKSFCLGFQFQGNNTQITMKDINAMGIRTVASAGGKVGSSMYHLEAVQELTQDDINYLPPLPIDGTKVTDYTDEDEEDKFFYIVQDQPLPFHICGLFLVGNYSATR